MVLGYTHPDQLLEELSGKQISEWEAFNRIQPIGARRFDFYYSSLMMTLHNIAVGFSGGKSAKQFEFKDFVPNWTGIEDEPEVMAPEKIKEFFVAFAETHNKEFLKKQEQETNRNNKKRKR